MILLERLQAATEGSRELDKEIANYFAASSLNNIRWPPYSRSIDAALALVERVRPGSELSLSRNADYCHATIWGKHDPVLVRRIAGQDERPDNQLPLAICCSLVKAETER